jgi:hypothetical protein
MTDSEKIDSIVLSIRTKYGENLMGYYVGEGKQKLSGKASVILYRPISIQHVEYMSNGKRFHNYTHTFYFPFGGSMVEILHDDIRNSEMADEFFSLYYSRALGEHLVAQEVLHMNIIDYYERTDLAEAMANTDSLYFGQTSEFKQ